MKPLLNGLGAALLATALAYVLALVVSLRLLMAEQGHAAVSLADQASQLIGDLPNRAPWGLLLCLAMGGCVAVALLLQRWLGVSRFVIMPLAGMLGMALVVWGLVLVYGLAPLAGATQLPGGLLYLLAGAAAGLLVAALGPGRP